MRMLNKRWRRHKMVVEAQDWEDQWEKWVWDKEPKPKWRRYVWYTGVKDNTPWWDEDDRIYESTDWWKVRFLGDHLGRTTVSFPVGWRRDVTLIYGQCWCNDFEPGEEDEYAVGCPMTNQTLKWLDEQKNAPLQFMVEELGFWSDEDDVI